MKYRYVARVTWLGDAVHDRMLLEAIVGVARSYARLIQARVLLVLRGFAWDGCYRMTFDFPLSDWKVEGLREL